MSVSRLGHLLCVWLCATTSAALAQTLVVDAANSPYVVATATTFSQLTISTGGVLVANAPISVTGDMVVQGTVTIGASVYTLKLDVAGLLRIDAGGAIEADGKGLPGCPASGYAYSGATLDPVTLMVVSTPVSSAAGGTHASSGGGQVAPIYGNAFDPSTPGGGGSRYGTGIGGAGGGVLRIAASTFVLNGSLRANGRDGLFPDFSAAGGGAGGSINLEVGTFSGAGQLSANGGLGNAPGAGGAAFGGAGRLKVTCTAYAFSGSYSARQGDGLGAGTVHVLDTTMNQLHVPGEVVLTGGEQYSSVVFAPGGSLTVLGAARVTTPLTIPAGNAVTLGSSQSLDAMSVARVDGTLIVNRGVTQRIGLIVKGRLVVNSTLTVPDVDTEQGAVITHDPQRTDMVLVVTGRLRLVLGALITGAGLGYPGSLGASGFGATIDPTTGNLVTRSPPGTGGSHGGLGGSFAPTLFPAELFDAPTAPRFCGGGGGGGNWVSFACQGGAGGGLLRLTAREFQLDGTVTVDGASGSCYSGVTLAPGSGAGGSIAITADQLSGAGTVSARGGSGIPWATSGGGGLINIATAASNFTGALSVAGGAGTWPGGAGVIVQEQLPSVPVIQSSPPAQVRLGSSVVYQASARGAAPISWALVSGPPTAALSSTGELSWLASVAGPQSFSLQARNGFGVDTQTFVLEVVAAPTITSVARPVAQRGAAWSYDDDGRVEASGSSPLTWKATRVPTSFSIDALTGEVHWVPASLGSHSACVEVSNAIGQAQQCFSVLVVDTVVGSSGDGPRFTSHPSTSASCGSAYHYSGTRLPEVSAEGPYLFSLAALEGSRLPDGLTIDADTGELTWTPVPLQRGAHAIVLTVSNARGADHQAFAIIVDCPEPRGKQVGCMTATDSTLVLALVALLGRQRPRKR